MKKNEEAAAKSKPKTSAAQIRVQKGECDDRSYERGDVHGGEQKSEHRRMRRGGDAESDTRIGDMERKRRVLRGGNDECGDVR
jgi:hypothetical protein